MTAKTDNGRKLKQARLQGRKLIKAVKIKRILYNVAKHTGCKSRAIQAGKFVSWSYDIKGDNCTGTGGEPVAFNVSKWCGN